MRNKMIFSALIIILVLSACGGSNEVASGDGESNDASAAGGSGVDSSAGADPGRGIDEDFQDAMPLSAQLGFGTLLLEDSEYAVDVDQAAQLLPLWKAARSLSESETAAAAELEAVFNQIEDTMTAEQINAIANLQLTGEAMAQLMEDLGISFGFGGDRFGNLTPEQQATAQAARESGEGPPGGGFPGGGQGRGGGQGIEGAELTPEQQATIEARRAERGGVGARFALVFVDPLIELLEERAAE
ncbi:MAG: hypothetical protein JJE12_12055 [Anaerolineales bacterium]|nr:hypothetical protein [Anaerolineales bacterium]